MKEKTKMIYKCISLLVIIFMFTACECSEKEYEDYSDQEKKVECEKRGWEPIAGIQACQITIRTCNCTEITRNYCGTVKDAVFATNENEPVCIVMLPDRRKGK